MYELKQTNCVNWYIAYITNCEQSEKIRSSCATAEEISLVATRFYLFEDDRGGFALSADGELLGLHSLNKGDGNCLVWEAVQRGAVKLNCFNIPHLIDLYNRYGFKETHREPNWNVGEPDVIFMERL